MSKPQSISEHLNIWDNKLARVWCSNLAGWQWENPFSSVRTPPMIHAGIFRVFYCWWPSAEFSSNAHRCILTTVIKSFMHVFTLPKPLHLYVILSYWCYSLSKARVRDRAEYPLQYALLTTPSFLIITHFGFLHELSKKTYRATVHVMSFITTGLWWNLSILNGVVSPSLHLHGMRTHWFEDENNNGKSYALAYTVTRSQPNWTPVRDFGWRSSSPLSKHQPREYPSSTVSSIDM